jgi:alkylation response protein AidB-like acyl-CoA dehydrogenase
MFDEGWMRWGWPVEVGGLGGSPVLRAVLGEELTSRGLVHSAAFSMPEVLAPAIITFADHELAAEMLPLLLRGDELWCQGFSEPDAGSDLGALRTAATLEGDDWIINGQKLWTSWAHHASRCIVLARTEPDLPKSKGISAFFVDMDTPGIVVRPMETMAGVDEFCETFFDRVRVPAGRLLGLRGQGWAVAQRILACERGPIFWQRGGWLLHHLGEAAAHAQQSDAATLGLLGSAYANVFALRARSRSTQWRFSTGDLDPAESSVDKILIASADKATFDACRHSLSGAVEWADDPLSDRFRKEWAYSRAASIYGGTSEIQRDILASRILRLPGPA